MINFFRLIRQGLIKENRLRKYLLYALGEIILVVIGILFALQVNNWNQQRKKDKVEQNALINLKEDFTYNHDLIKKLILESDSIIKENRLIIDHTGKRYEPNTVFDLDSLLSSVTYNPKFNPRNGFLYDLLNSGNLGIFKNVELRKLLSSWNPTLDRLIQRENNCYELNNKIEDYITENGSWVNLDNKYGVYDFHIEASGFKVDNNDMLGDLEFENFVDNHIYYINALKNRQIEVLALIDQIIMLIKQEIKN